jgi:dienelactone hydrolase
MRSTSAEIASHGSSKLAKLAIATTVVLAALASTPGAEAQTANRQLPKPTGAHAVGKTSYFWKDDARGEPNTPDEDDRRELRVDVWYPASATADAKPAESFSDLKALSKTLGPESLLVGAIKGNALDDPAVVAGADRFPAIVFSPGLCTNGSQYAFIVEELASHGYLVATIDHPYQSRAIAYPDGRIVTVALERRDADPAKAESDYRALIDWRAADLRFVLDRLLRLNEGEQDQRFKGRIDGTRVGAFGHSIGGNTAPQAGVNDSRFKASLNMDGHHASLPFFLDEQGRGPRQPFMELTDGMPPATDRQLAQWKMTREQFDRERVQAARRVDDAMRTVAAGSYRVTIPGVRHNSFGDMAMWDAEPLEVRYRRMQIIRDYVRAFFDKHLSNRTDTLLDASQGPYPEVKLERFQSSQ